MNLVQRIEKRSREHPRIRVVRPVAMVKGDGGIVVAETHNVAPGGMQVHCDWASAYDLLPERGRLPAARAPRVDAHFTLPISSGLAKIDVECQLVYFCEILRKGFALGLAFTHFKDYSFLKLDRFIEEASARSEAPPAP